MDATAALEELCARYELPDHAADQLQKLVDLVVADSLAPTTVRDPGKVIGDHIADSLVALELPFGGITGEAVDIGAGAGLPGLVLAIARPDWPFVLLEASGRKSAFIERAASRCGARNVQVVNARAEAWLDGIERFVLATARALGPLEVVLEYASPLLRQGGRLIAWRGRRDPGAEARADRAARELGMELCEVRHVVPYRGAEHRHLHVAAKVAPTPGRFPRRPGVATKRPLGARDRTSSDRLRR